jgi:hypothetical protein
LKIYCRIQLWISHCIFCSSPLSIVNGTGFRIVSKKCTVRFFMTYFWLKIHYHTFVVQINPFRAWKVTGIRTKQLKLHIMPYRVDGPALNKGYKTITSLFSAFYILYICYHEPHLYRKENNLPINISQRNICLGYS